MKPEDQQRFEIEGVVVRGGVDALCIACTHCGAWHATIDSPADLAELNQRADEHTEVCR